MLCDTKNDSDPQKYRSTWHHLHFPLSLQIDEGVADLNKAMEKMFLHSCPVLLHTFRLPLICSVQTETDCNVVQPVGTMGLLWKKKGSLIAVSVLFEETWHLFIYLLHSEWLTLLASCCFQLQMSRIASCMEDTISQLAALSHSSNRSWRYQAAFWW